MSTEHHQFGEQDHGTPRGGPDAAWGWVVAKPSVAADRRTQSSAQCRSLGRTEQQSQRTSRNPRKE